MAVSRLSPGSARQGAPRPSDGSQRVGDDRSNWLMLEELLAAEQLIVRVLDPARAKILVAEIVHVLEDRWPRHQPRRQRRVSGLVGIDRAEPLLKKRQSIAQPSLANGWSMSRRSGRAAPGTNRSAAVPPLPGPHQITLHKPTERQRSRSNEPDQFARKEINSGKLSCKRNNLTILGGA